ncbi:uncharacterized protein LOC100376470 [Saccoglossus kowalevskii]|uniref:Uncharacterized protein LOC100376470 n=1 Tax=Saccoglossus kowalevskii TaxID=10224 RepID=A0ABM0GQ11_SACKO|nr:PREDICTED: uncharacterized protein LOC100376470 [Saccoglossus kowalevskii]
MRTRSHKYLVGIVVALITLLLASVALFVCVYVVVRPSLQKITTEAFQVTNCTVFNTTSHVKDCTLQCAHGYNCPSSYKCDIIRVIYDVNGSGNSTETRNSVLYDELRTLNSETQCSLGTPCPDKKDIDVIKADIFNFTSMWGKRESTYECYHDNENNVVLKVDSDVSDGHKIQVFHAIFWPTAVMVFSIVSCGYFQYRRNKMEKRLQEYVDRLGLHGNGPSNVIYQKLETTSPL